MMDPNQLPPQPSGQMLYPPAINHYQNQLPGQGYNLNHGGQGLGSYPGPQYGMATQMQQMGGAQNMLPATAFGGPQSQMPQNQQHLTPGGGIQNFQNVQNMQNVVLPGGPQMQQQGPPANQQNANAYPPFYGPQLNPTTAQFFSVYEPPPAVTPPPADPEEAKRIDKVAEYAAKNGQQFEALMKEKQKDNPAYAFLVGGENSGYYRYKLWTLLNPHIPVEQMAHVAVQPPPQQGAYGYGATPPQDSFAGYPPTGQFNPPAAAPIALALPDDISAKLADVLEKLTGTKESIKGTKAWFLDHAAAHLDGMVAALRDRVVGLEEVDKQLHVIYLVNDILFSSLGQRAAPSELDAISLGFRPVLGAMLAATYNNSAATDTNKERLSKILQFWGSKDVFDSATITALENEMLGKPSVPPPPETAPQTAMQIPPQTYTPPPGPFVPPTAWTPPLQQPYFPPQQDPYHFGGQPMLGPAQPPTQFSAPRSTGFSSTPFPPDQFSQPATPAEPDFPPFPPGLIPGMVRKMQVGSGVPYSPISPLDIPTVIPPAAQSEAYIISRLRKFYKEVGVGGDDLEVDLAVDLAERRRFTDTKEMPMPTLNMEVNADTGVIDDGSFYGGGSGRSGLGAGPGESREENEDEFSSFRKARSTNYHMSIGVRTT